MQHIFYRLVSILLLISWATSANAQKDSVLVINTTRDSVKMYYKYYSVHQDSVKRKMVLKRQSDSLFKKQGQIFKTRRDNVRFDSLKRMNVQRNISDSSYIVSLKRYSQCDSLNGVHFQKMHRDSGYRKATAFHKTELSKLKHFSDSSFRKTVKFRKMDSLKLKLHLQELKFDMQKMMHDSARQHKMKNREITMEVPINMNKSFCIDNIGRKVIVRTTEGKTIRVKTNIRYEGEIKLSDIEWYEKINLQFKIEDTAITIQPKIKRLIEKKIIAENDKGSVVKKEYTEIEEDDFNLRNNTRTTITVYVPANIMVNALSSYSDIRIESFIKNLKVTINNASLNMENADKVTIISKYGGISAGNIAEANLDLTNTNLVADDINKLTVISKNSKIRFDRSDKIFLTSSNDQYQIEQVNYIEGSKNFGKLNIENLKNNIVLTGHNSDVKIGIVDVKVDLIRIDNKYADVKIPLSTLTSYTVNFDGKNSRVFTSFDKQAVASADTLKTDRTNFTANIGDLKGDHTKLQINCSSCNVNLEN